jgi:predicted nucleotide-binding protein (sugar kinase/HSP70/actin superfamily)
MKENCKIRIGIPRALLYHELFPLWKAFFEELNLEVITSGETTEEVIRRGINSTGSDLCLPVKTFLGHVHVIKDSVDFLFVPRYISIEEDAYMCPKFLGLPDMVRASITLLPPIIDAPMNLKKGGQSEFLYGIGKILRIDKRDVENAYRKAEKLNTEIATPPLVARNDKRGIGLKIALLGRPYLLYDSYINRSIIRRLNTLGAEAILSNGISEEDIKGVMTLLSKVIYWSMDKEVVTSAYYHLRDRDVAGIINLVSVACGPDSFTSEIINELRKKMPAIPYMTLYLDEHTSDLGILTRIEAFIDMIRRRCPEVRAEVTRGPA